MPGGMLPLGDPTEATDLATLHRGRQQGALWGSLEAANSGLGSRIRGYTLLLRRIGSPINGILQL